MKLCLFFQVLAGTCVLFLGSQQPALGDDAPKADVIIYNAKVLTVNRDFDVAQAVAIKGDRILDVGKDRVILKLAGTNTQMVDGSGRIVMPGLHDGNVMSYRAAGETNAATNFDSITDALGFIRAEAAQKPAGTWIIVENAFPTRVIEKRLPTKEELDAAAPKHPVYWDCGAMAVLNSKALALAGIGTSTNAPVGVEIALDAVTHEPTGLIYGASNVVKLPVTTEHVSAQERRDALKQLYQTYNKEGITSIDEDDAGPEAINLFRDMCGDGELTVRINCARRMETGATIGEALAHLNALTNVGLGKFACGPTGLGNDWVRIGPLKVRMDGNVQTGTAFLRTPWGMGPMFQITDPAYRGRQAQDTEMLTALFNEAAKRGWQVSADCAGNAALDQLLNCYQKVQFKTDIHRRRFLVNEATFQANEDWGRCKDLGILASVQPAVLYYDGDSLLQTLGEKRLRNFVALKTWFDNGLIAGGGNGDFPAVAGPRVGNAAGPWFGMWIALTRVTERDANIHPAEKLTREEAIRLYTINNATLHFDEQSKGSIEPDKFADLIMLDRDILKCPVDDIRETKALMTIVGGKVVWQAKEIPTLEVSYPEKQSSPHFPSAS